MQIWSVHPDGSGARPLISDGYSNSPQVCGGGRYIVYAAWRNQTETVWRMDPDGANAQQLTQGKDDWGPVCADNSEWVYYLAHDAIRKVPLAGGQSVEIVSRDLQPDKMAISPDGRMLLTSILQSSTINFVILDPDGHLLKTLKPRFRLAFGFTPDSRAILYADRTGRNLMRQPLEDDTPAQPITDFISEQIPRFAWSRDGKQLVLTRTVPTQDVVLIRNFR